MDSKTKKTLFSIFVVVAVDVFAFAVVLPILPFYAQTFGATPFQVGLLLTSFAFCQFLSGPALGRISDVIGRKPVLFLSQVGTLIGFIIMAKAPSLSILLLARVIDGITAGNLSVAQAAISDVTRPEDRAKAFGIIGIAFGLGFFLGPALSGYLSQFGYEYPAWLAAGLSFFSIVLTLFVLPETIPAKSPLRQFKLKDFFRVLDFQVLKKSLSDPVLRSLLFQFFLFNLSFTMYISGFPLFAERQLTWNGKTFGSVEVGYVYTFVGFLGIFVQGYLLGKLVKLWGEKKLSRIGFTSQGLGFLLVGYVFKIPLLLLAAAVSSFGSGVVRPAITSLISRSADPKEQGLVLGLGQSFTAIAAIVAPLISGLLINYGYLHAWSLASGAFALLALFI